MPAARLPGAGFSNFDSFGQLNAGPARHRTAGGCWGGDSKPNPAARIAQAPTRNASISIPRSTVARTATARAQPTPHASSVPSERSNGLRVPYTAGPNPSPALSRSPTRLNALQSKVVQSGQS